MTPIRIFISSVQSEFADERAALGTWLRSDPLMRRFFEVFLFEDVPASDRRPDEVYLDEVARCDLFVGLFGERYGAEDAAGISPTEQEFDCATVLGKHRLIFLKGAEASARHPKMRALIDKAQAGLIRKRFVTAAELVTGLYAALVEYLEVKELLRFGPFDATPCIGASLDDLDFERMSVFIRTARRARQFPLPEDTTPEALLEHLDLSKNGRLTNAAVLLFGNAPQRFLISSQVKCAHFHGTEVAKPIPSYQVYKGTVFEMVDQAVDFVLSKINRSIGTRAESVRAPRTYEIPPEVVTEAIVNAVVHRDYTDNSSVQVMLFADRLDVMNSGSLPPELTLEKLRVPHTSVPGNPLLAESMYLAEYIERMGTGTLDMIRRCVDAGLPEPEFVGSGGFVTTIRRAKAGVQARVTPEVAPEVAPEVMRLLSAIDGEMRRAEIQAKLGLADEKHFREQYQQPAVVHGFIEMTIPDRPRSRLQKYRLTDKGRTISAGKKRGTESDLDLVQAEVTPEVTPEVMRLLSVIDGEMRRAEIQAKLGLADEKHFREQYQQPAVAHGFIEMTIPDRPRSRLQKYRLTDKGRAVLGSGNRIS